MVNLISLKVIYYAIVVANSSSKMGTKEPKAKEAIHLIQASSLTWPRPALIATSVSTALSVFFSSK